MDSREVLPPRMLLDGSYRILRVVGAGGFGITYEAEDLNLGTVVAIKEYYPFDFGERDATMSVRPRSERHKKTFDWGRSNFLREARTLARFEHPSIVRVLRVFEANATAYTVMRFERGENFEAWLRGLGRLPKQEELDRISGSLLNALEVMHAADFLHRDIAPDNIIVRDDGTPVLLDFGSARHAVAEMSRSLTGIVKAGYSPHEQYSSDSRLQGPWSDFYALGGTFYRAVVGRAPEEATLRVDHDTMPPAALAARDGGYRPSFLAAIDACLKVRQGERPQSVAQLRAMLLDKRPLPMTRHLVEPIRAQTVRTVAAFRTASSRWPGAAAAAIVVLLGGAYAGYEYTRWQPAEHHELDVAAEVDRKEVEAARRKADAKRRADAEAAELKRKADAEAKRKAEVEVAELKRKADAEAKHKADAEAAELKRKADAEAKRKAEVEAAELKRKADADTKRKADAEAAEATRKAEAEAAEVKRKSDVEAKRKADAEAGEAKRKADAEAKRKTEADAAEAKQRADAEVKRKAETEAAESKRKSDAEAKRKAEAETKRKADAEAAELKRRADAEAKRKADAEAAESKRRADAEVKRKAEAEAAESKRKTDAEAKRKADAEAAAKRKADAETKRKAETDAAESKRKSDADAEARRKAEADAAEPKRYPDAGRQPAVAIPCLAAEVKSKPNPAVAKILDGQLAPESRRLIQIQLKRRGFLAEEPNGDFGPSSRQAIRKFQKHLAAQETGYLTACQLQALQ